MTFKLPPAKKGTFREKLKRMKERWNRVWTRHRAHKKHTGSRRKP